MSEKHILVVGATGVAGAAFVAQFVQGQLSGAADWQLTGVSRRPPDETAAGSDASADSLSRKSVSYVSADLLGEHGSLAGLDPVTHVVFAGFVPGADFESLVAPNRNLLINCLAALKNHPVRRVILIQGMKYYGSNLGPFKTPAREDDPRLDGPNYYYAQQDVLEQGNIDWVCLRPHVICGTRSIGTPQNILTVVGAYASLMKAQGKPLSWPGTPEAYQCINQATDANLLARCIAWSIDEPHAVNQAFNVTNGDFFRWQHLWPRIAERFAMECGPVQPQSLTQSMATSSDAWQALVAGHGLRKYELSQIAHWPFADYIFNVGWDVMASTVKARQYGFSDCLDTEAMYLKHLTTLQQNRVLPGG